MTNQGCVCLFRRKVMEIFCHTFLTAFSVILKVSILLIKTTDLEDFF